MLQIKCIFKKQHRTEKQNLTTYNKLSAITIKKTFIMRELLFKRIYILYKICRNLNGTEFESTTFPFYQGLYNH